MWMLSRTCPDCQTELDALNGASRCETCWLVVPLSVRGRDGVLRETGRWMRLPPALQRVEGIVTALRAACRRGRTDGLYRSRSYL